MFSKKTFNFANSDKPGRKKVMVCEQSFTSYLATYKIFVDYETTNERQLYNFS